VTYPTPPVPTQYPVEIKATADDIRWDDAGYLAEVIYHADDNGPNRQLSAKLAQAVLGNGYRRVIPFKSAT
jgi:hypothetical protein